MAFLARSSAFAAPIFVARAPQRPVRRVRKFGDLLHSPAVERRRKSRRLEAREEGAASAPGTEQQVLPEAKPKGGPQYSEGGQRIPTMTSKLAVAPSGNVSTKYTKVRRKLPQ